MRMVQVLFNQAEIITFLLVAGWWDIFGQQQYPTSGNVVNIA